MFLLFIKIITINLAFDESVQISCYVSYCLKNAKMSHFEKKKLSGALLSIKHFIKKKLAYLYILKLSYICKTRFMFARE